MSGSLTIPTVFANLAQGNQPLSLVDGAFNAVSVYVNDREITIGLLASRPAAGKGGRYYFATDVNGGTLYVDTSVTWQQIAPGLSEPAQNAFIGVLVGCTLSNDGGSPNTTLDVSAGACTDDNATFTSRVIMSLAAITGTVSGTWVVGTGQPKLDAGSVGTSTTYHVFVIKRVDTNVVDILFSTSPTSPTMPTNYTKKRRIGSFRVDGSSHIIAFVQDGDYFALKASVLDISSVNPGTAAVTATLASVPTGVNVFAHINAGVRFGSAGPSATEIYVSDLAVNDEAPSFSAAPLASTSQNVASAVGQYVPMRVRTNTSAQVRYRLGASDGNTTAQIATLGWFDRRGQDS